MSRIDALSMPMAKLKDRVQTAQFWLDSRGRKRRQDELSRLSTLEEYFDYSSRVFGPHQLKAEIMGFLKLAADQNPRVVCEIGTANGGTTFLLGQALHSTETLIGIDLFVRRRSRLRHLARPGQELVLVDGDSTTREVHARVSAALADRRLDLLFIDGDHSFKGVAADFRNFRHFVRPGGLIAFHDIVEDSYTRTGVRTPHWTGEVPQFWRLIKPFYRNQEFIASAEQDGLGIGVIHYDPTVTPPDGLS